MSVLTIDVSLNDCVEPFCVSLWQLNEIGLSLRVILTGLVYYVLNLLHQLLWFQLLGRILWCCLRRWVRLTQLNGLLCQRSLIGQRISLLVALHVSVCLISFLCRRATVPLTDLSLRRLNSIYVCTNWPLNDNLGIVCAFYCAVIPLRSLQLLEICYLLL